MTNQKTTAVLAVALLAASSNAFLVPSSLPVRSAQSSSSTVMSAEQPAAGIKSVAASFLAGIMLTGAAMQGADAALFDVQQDQTQLQRSVGFGQPGALDDSSNNNAASGKENGSKYDIQQQGKFADANSKGAVDYGSAKGTDFGKLAGGKEGVATNNKATDGDFLADAKQNTREGTKIADKNVKDAANVDVKDIKDSNQNSIRQSVESAKDTLKSTGSQATASAPTWGNPKQGVKQGAQQVAKEASKAADKATGGGWTAPWSTGAKNSAKPGEKSLNNGFTSGLKGVSISALNLESLGNDVKQAADKATAAVSNNDAVNKVQEGIDNVASATSDLRDPNVDASLKTPEVGGAFGTNSRGQAQKVASKTQSKVKGDINTAKNAASNVQNKAPNSIGDAGNAIKNKVDSDINTAQRAVDDATPNNLQSKAQQKIGDVKSAVKDATNTDSNAPASTLLSVEGGFLGTQPKTQLETAGQKTVDKVKGDIETARANPPFQEGQSGAVNVNQGQFNNLNGPLSGGKKAVQNKVNKDVGDTKNAWSYGPSKVANKAGNKVDRDVKTASRWGSKAQNKVESDVNTAQNAVGKWTYKAKQAVSNNDVGNAVQNKVSGDIKTAQRAGNQAQSAINNNDAGNAVQNKVSSDIKTAQRAGNDVKRGINNNTPNTPQVGGLFSTDPKGQADTVARKTQQKVSSDINAVKGARNDNSTPDLASIGNKIQNALTN